MAVSPVSSTQRTKAPTLKPIAAPASTRDKKVSAGPATIVRTSTKQPTPPVAYSPAAIKKTAAAAQTPPTQAGAKPAMTTTGSFVANGGNVKVDVLASDSGYDNKLYWSSDNWQTKHYIGIDNQQQTVDLGQMAAGTKIEFGIDNGQGDFFKTGGATANSDNFDHAKIDNNSDGSTTIGFEDLRGGGDQDFNDAIIRVHSDPAAQAPEPTKTPVAKTPDPVKTPAPITAKPPEPVKTPAPVTVKAPEPVKTPAPVTVKPPEPVKTTTPAPSTNHSGLGDSTNPGNGGGKINSPNSGTNNPNQSAKAPAVKAPEVKTVVKK